VRVSGMVRRIGLPFLIGLAWLIVKSVLLSYLPEGVPVPDVILVLVVLAAFRYPVVPASGLAFSLGLMQDVMSGGVLGLHALSKTVVCALTATMAARFYFPNLVAKVGMVVLGGLADALLITIVQSIEHGLVQSVIFLTHHLLLQVVVTGAVTPPIAVATTRLFTFTDVEEESQYPHEAQGSRNRRT